jgi:hypothetical protein
MLFTVCIEAGRSTLTHTSWTGFTIGSRKWMSGQAAALAATQSRTPFANLSAPHPLPDLDLPRVRRPPSPTFTYHGCPPVFRPRVLPQGAVSLHGGWFCDPAYPNVRINFRSNAGMSPSSNIDSPKAKGRVSNRLTTL